LALRGGDFVVRTVGAMNALQDSFRRSLKPWPVAIAELKIIKMILI
jgi:hypothetical protein